MLITKEYDRLRAQMYAERWALSRNPLFLDFTGRGGDCTSFVSQAVLAGGCVMNFTPTYGWYYVSPDDRAAAWTGVPYFYNFMTRREVSPGPFGEELSQNQLYMLMPGDFVQLRFTKDVFEHTPIVVSVRYPFKPENILLAAHSQDADFRPLSTYSYLEVRYLHMIDIFYKGRLEF